MENIWEKDLGEELFLSYTEILNQAVAPLDDILVDAGSVWFRDIPRKEVLSGEPARSPGRTHETARSRLHRVVLGPPPHPHPGSRPRKQKMARSVLLARPLPHRRRRRHREQLLLPPLPPLRPSGRRIAPDAGDPERSHPLTLRHRSGSGGESGVDALPRPSRAVAQRPNHQTRPVRKCNEGLPPADTRGRPKGLTGRPFTSPASPQLLDVGSGRHLKPFEQNSRLPLWGHGQVSPCPTNYQGTP